MESSLFNLLAENSFTRYELNKLLLNYEKGIYDKALNKYIYREDEKRKKSLKNKEIRRINFFNDVISDIDNEVYETKKMLKNYEV